LPRRDLEGKLIAEMRVPIPDESGTPRPVSITELRAQWAPPISSCCLPPLEGWRHVKVTDRHITAVDYARGLERTWPTSHFAARQRPSFWSRTISAIHSKAFTPTKPFPAVEARRPGRALRMALPLQKHGSWLDLAESELGRPNLPVPQSPHSQQNKSSSDENRRLGERPQFANPHQGRLGQFTTKKCSHQNFKHL